MVCSLIDYRTDLVPVPRKMVKFKPGLSQILSEVFLSNPGLALVGLSGTGPLRLKLRSIIRPIIHQCCANYPADNPSSNVDLKRPMMVVITVTIRKMNADDNHDINHDDHCC